MPARKDLEQAIWVGDTFELPLQFMKEGQPHSLEGKTVIFMIKYSPFDLDTDAILTVSETFPDPHALVELGEYSIWLHSSQTANLPVGQFHYQVQVITPATPENLVVTYIWGRVCVKDS